jgi:PTH2 family peptidyl-tRNA hydrolase
MPVKQAIVIRKDLNMRRGKEIGQGSHCSSKWLIDRVRVYRKGFELAFTQDEIEWMDNDFPKIVLQVNSEEELRAVELAAKTAGLTVETITDLGKTEFNGVPTLTSLAIGPHDSAMIDPITKNLKLY